MVGEDLNAGPDNEQHEEHVQEMLKLQPPGKARVDRGRGLGDSWMLLDEGLHRGQFAKALGDGDQDHQRRVPIGSAQSTLIQRWPMRRRGTIPAWGGIQ